jgi:hypothetical protein
VLVVAFSISGAALRGQQPGQPEPRLKAPSEAEIRKGIRLATEYVQTNLHSGVEEAHAALAVVALLKSGAPKNSPAVKDALARIAARVKDNRFVPGQHFVYDAGISCMALGSADPVKYRPQMQAIASFIIANQGPEGDWDYPNRTTGDTSISQYAMLGLWEAARAGIRVPTEVWDKAASWHLTRQYSDGGFGYHPVKNLKQGETLHSMTAAALGSLYIARRYLYPDLKDKGPEPEPVAVAATAPPKKRERFKYGILERIAPEAEAETETADGPVQDLSRGPDPNYSPKVRLAEIDSGIQRGLKWLEDHFTVTRPTGYPIYYLYGLERLGALGNHERIGDRDWYGEGAAHILKLQNPNEGSIQENSGALDGTSFALLFLSKATAKMLRRSRESQFGAGLLAGGRGLPDNLGDVQIKKGKVEAKKLPGKLGDLLAELENPKSELVESAQEGLVEKVLLDRPEDLIGQTERLLKLAKDPRPEVRRTAIWALGRSGDLRVAPVLIAALEDANLDVVVEARNGLRILSRKVEEFAGEKLQADNADLDRPREIAKWRAWYLTVRPYEERTELPPPRKGK